jgi:hypothetical protein
MSDFRSPERCEPEDQSASTERGCCGPRRKNPKKRVKLLRVVEMNHCGQAADRPVGNDSKMAEVLLFFSFGSTA